ncbi:VOC family protein [Alteromonas sp. 345S023]|uniref:VOC family protein n=1 Tax=Alteromonas profundi TaxID=2696062 RepID=A0A7X5LN69_9ALTE|nr:VOC family protein [Alteromonas profundi]NDV92428.1 VOC family protein [Alteromonas profundi]
MLSGFHHVAIICSDYPTSKAFYTDVLGFRILDENYRAARNSYKCDIALPDGSQIELFSFPGAPERPSRPEAQGLRHLAFKVSNIEDVIAHLANHQVACEPIRTDPYTNKRFTFFQDPDGLPLELYEQ